MIWLYWVIAAATMFLAVLPLAMLLGNLPVFERPPNADRGDEDSSRASSAVSVLIPARDEEDAIGPAVRSALQNGPAVSEVVVLDDHSRDGTADVVRALAADDPRVRLASSEPLPAGWNGKQHACWQLAKLATADRLLFLDADVRLSPDAIQRLELQRQRRPVDLLSGFPRQVTGSWAERMLIPLMYVVLLCYLPLRRARQDNRPPLAAGCGQLFYADRAAYFEAGGHAAIASSRHDGLMLPREFRRAGRTSDVFDAAEIASCRMYRDLKSVRRGLLKNAVEGIANPRLIGVFSVLLLGGFVLPILLWAHAAFWEWPAGPTMTLAFAALVSLLPRAILAARFEQQWWTALANPLAVLWFVALQWQALSRHLRGKSVAWRGRSS